MLFAILVIIILVSYLAPFSYGFILRKQRDKIFKDLASDYNFNVTLDYQNYAYDYKVPVGKAFFELRTLRGGIKGKNVLIQDREYVGPLNAQIQGWRGILRGPSSFWFYHFSAPFNRNFRWGAKTIFSIDGRETDISSRGFWDIISFANEDKIKSTLVSVASQD